MINVTKPFLPPREEFDKYIDGIWQRNCLTNNGPLVKELELKLTEYLQVPHMLYLNNGTIALQIAIRALGLKGEIITTPFSYVATTSSIVWEGCTPVFVDIDPGSLNIDPTKIEAAITNETSAIIATHVYGNPCDVEAIQQIAHKHNLKVIYDAAHCFGTKYKGKSIYTYGDVSTASFHATKLFHTIEGGAVVTGSLDLHHKMSYMRNFGHAGLENFSGLGINGKNSEFHAAMGLVNLNHISSILEKRKKLCLLYDQALGSAGLRKQVIASGTEYNYSYYPIVFDSEEQLLRSLAALNGAAVYPRRYFYPSLTSLQYVTKSPMPVADGVSKCVLCLPLYHTLTEEEIYQIATVLKNTIRIV